MTPYHLSALRSTFTRALPSPMSQLTTVGRKYSAFSGFSLSALSKNRGNRAQASSKKLRLKPHMFMDTMVSPERPVQVAPPSSV